MSERRKNNRSYQYNNSSSAHDYSYNQPYINGERIVKERFTNREVHEEMKRINELERKRKLQIKKEREQLLKRKESIVRDRRNHILCYIIAFYLIAVGVFALNQFDKNNLIKRQISEKQKIIKEQEKAIQDAKILVANSIDIREVERIAKEELGMKTPSYNQIVYITLPKNRNYIEYDSIENSTNNNVKNNENEVIIKNKGIDGSF